VQPICNDCDVWMTASRHRARSESAKSNVRRGATNRSIRQRCRVLRTDVVEVLDDHQGDPWTPRPIDPPLHSSPGHLVAVDLPHDACSSPERKPRRVLRFIGDRDQRVADLG
jgi:hypothetical protein